MNFLIHTKPLWKEEGDGNIKSNSHFPHVSNLNSYQILLWYANLKSENDCRVLVKWFYRFLHLDLWCSQIRTKKKNGTSLLVEIGAAGSLSEANLIFFGCHLKLTFSILSVLPHVRHCKFYVLCHSKLEKTFASLRLFLNLPPKWASPDQTPFRTSRSLSAAMPGRNFAGGLYIFFGTRRTKGSGSHVVRLQPCLTPLTSGISPLSNKHA